MIQRKSPLFPTKRGPNTGLLVGGGLAAVALVGLTAVVAVAPDTRTGTDGCLLNQAPPQAFAQILDTSHPLVDQNPREAEAETLRSLARLERGARIQMYEARETDAELKPFFAACHPGNDDNAARLKFKTEVAEVVSRRLHDLGRQSADSSPLIETLLGVASDRSLMDAEGDLHILLETDALQNSAFASVYGNTADFPGAVGHPLRGVHVTLVVLKNRRDSALQRDAALRLKRWMVGAGATVTYRQPAWMSVEPIAGETRT